MLKSLTKNPHVAWSQAAYPTGWGAEIANSPQLKFTLTATFLEDVDRCLATARDAGRKMDEIDRSDFSSPAIDGAMEQLLKELRAGTGLVIMQGLDAERYSPADLEIILFGLGMHLGNAVSQSSYGDLLGHVAVRDKTSARGYTSDRQLELHTDSAEIICLLCVREAISGGESVFANSLRIRDIISQERPDLLRVLEQGYPYHRRGEEASGAEPITPYDIPVFSQKDGLTSCRYVREIIEVAYRDLGKELTGIEKEALDFLDEVATRDDVSFKYPLRQGEIAWMNNYQVLHARTAFQNHEDLSHGRLLYRLWLQDFPSRPMVKEMLVYQNPEGRQGIDPQPGRPAGLAKYSTRNH